ncbi:hypothetical protein ELH68_30790 (plasmid) [Rhizobium ruizarguesonis]|nr:hypothetical protein ELH68_30790 [Rhizobium ruizarguesonis]TAZ91906.1 hypothetical protein ELH64_30280 [Rhizobium ruizarguesonis]TBA14103.1 hypothetical protein ELH61_27690 [Rhizobium ruizarguesonis]TBB42035.1 hypothetical protein ELH44_26960 [Rhizobium ruizarguesonis]TBB61696.1 hypothetical protein ELH45_30730 [Rhizobium ruizarguesonis]
MIISIEAMHLLPHPFDVQAPHPPPRVVCGMTALLLPAVVRFFSKSLPHLLPRQAFSFWPKKIPDRAEATTCDHRLTTASSSPEILLIYSQIFFRALAGLASPQARTDKPVDTKLVVQLCNRMDTAAAEQAGQDRLPQ